MNIKQAAEQSGVSARNIRYYEQAGLLTPARNPENEYRIYSQADVRTLKLIRMLRTLDMPVEEIGTVLNGTLPLAEAAERQRQRLEAEQQKLAAAAAFCTELAAGDRTAAELDVDDCLARMDSPAPAGGWFTGWVQDYRKMAAAEHKRQFTFTPDTAIATPQEFTAELLAWAAGCGEEIVITPRRFPIALRHGGGSPGIGGAEGFHCSFHGIGSALTHLGQGRFQGSKVVFVLCTVAHCVFLLSRTGPKCNPRCACPAGC